MIKYFDKEIHTREAFLELMAEELSGTCMKSWTNQMEDEYLSPGVKEFGITEDEYTKYLDERGIVECESCGWWTYSGEATDQLCSHCFEEQEENED